MKNNQNYYTFANIRRVKWGVLEENQPIHLFPVIYPCWSGIVRDVGKILGKPQTNIINLNHYDKSVIFIDHQEWNELGKFTLRKILKNPTWGFYISRKIIILSDILTKFSSQKIHKADLSKKTNQQLYHLYKEYLDNEVVAYNYAAIPVYLDLYKPHLTTYLLQYLDKIILAKGYKMSARECFVSLTMPAELSRVQIEELDLYRLAIKLKPFVKKNKLPKLSQLPKFALSLFKKHADKYRYLGYNWEGPAFSDYYFWKRLEFLIKDKIVPEVKIKEFYLNKKKSVALATKIKKDLGIDQKHNKLLELTKQLIYSKEYRKMAFVQSYYEVEKLLKEIADRLSLSLEEVRVSLQTEVKLMLQGKMTRPKELSERIEGHLFVVLSQKLPGRVFTDDLYLKTKEYLLKREDLHEINYFHGQTACLGKAEGVVRIINSVKDIGKMKKGDILVSTQTNPDLVPAMRKAAAIVTDLGGITCHAAIVSRELGLPCVIGTKVATKALKDGDRVVVDASRGEIKKIN